MPAPRRALARVVIAAALTLLGQTTAVPPAQAADDMLLRAYVATFNGTGRVLPPGDGQPSATIQVSTNNPVINEHECSAVAYVGTVPQGVVSCSFGYFASFTPVNRASCAGTATGTGTLVLHLPTGLRIYSFPGMVAVVDDGTAHGLATEVIDPDSGNSRQGYAEFQFAAPCGSRGPNTGRAMY